jgi:hypothetical protein
VSTLLHVNQTSQTNKKRPISRGHGPKLLVATEEVVTFLSEPIITNFAPVRHIPWIVIYVLGNNTSCTGSRRGVIGGVQDPC